MKCPRCGYEWESKIPNPKECPRCKGRLDYTPGPVGAPKIGKKGGEKVMVSKLTWATAMILIVAVAGVGAWAILGGAPAPTAPVWNSVFGLSGAHNNSGIIAIYCVKATTDLTTDPSTWVLNDNYYDRIDSQGTLTVPTLTDFYIVVEARGNSPYVVGNNRDNIKVEGFANTLRENKTGSTGDQAFSWYTTEGSENIRVSAAFDEDGGTIGNPWNLTGDTSFDYTAKVFLYY